MVFLAGLSAQGAAGGRFFAPPDAAHACAARRHQGIPSLAATPDGRRMWATWYASPTGCEDSNNYLVLAASADGGATWKELLVYDPDGLGPLRAFDPEIWIGPGGRLCWSWTERLSPLAAETTDAYAGCHASPENDRLMVLEVDARAASDPSTVAAAPVREVARGVMMCKPLAARDGTWLFPVARWQAETSACVFASTDGGRTLDWRGGATLPSARRKFDEHNLVELSDGTLRAYIRVADSGAGDGLWEAASGDGGRTWGEARPSVLPHVSSRVFVRRLSSGKLLLVKNGRPGEAGDGRKDLTAYLSADDGKTWPCALVIDERRDVSYPDGQQLADGRLAVVYDHDRTGAQEILLAMFREEDVVAGRFVSADARSRVVVSRRPASQESRPVGPEL